MIEPIPVLLSRALHAIPEAVDFYCDIEGGVARGYVQFQAAGASTPYRSPHFAVPAEGRTPEQVIDAILAAVEA